MEINTTKANIYPVDKNKKDAEETNSDALLLCYVDIVNRICMRIAQEEGKNDLFDQVTLSDIP